MALRIGRGIAVAAMLALVVQTVAAGPLRDRLRVRQTPAAADLAEDEPADAPERLPTGVELLRDVAYGADPRQRFDVYRPRQARGAPLILMVHGGAWRVGDKSARSVVANKVGRWVGRGFIVVSANYRMLPEAPPAEQARDVERALAALRGRAGEWGGDPDRVVLMGHSAGAHLVALLGGSPERAPGVVGTVLLDSAALDLPVLMATRHLPLYDRAFGANADEWPALSPYHQMRRGAAPMLAVCSSQRADSCPQARRFAERAATLGNRVAVLPEDRSHAEINRELGEEGAYTRAVEAFLSSLDPALALRLGNPGSVGAPAKP